MNRSAAAIGIGVLAIAVIVGVILYLQLPSPDAPPQPAPQAAQAPQVGTPSAQVPAGDATPGRTDAMAVDEDHQRGLGAPTFDVVRVDRKGNVVIAGKAGPECVVTVRDGDAVVGTATADRRGDWVIVPGEPLDAGEAKLALSARCGDAAPVEADRMVVLIVPERGTAVAVAPSTGKADDGAKAGTGTEAGSSGAIAVAVPRDASKPAEIMQPSTASTDGVAIDSVDYDDKGEVVISGRAAPNSDVQVYLDNRNVGRARADASGHWKLVPDEKVAPGQYALRADRVRPDGSVVARAEIPFVRGEPLSDLPEGRVVVIKPGDYLWKIARASYGAGRRYTVIYDANRGQIHDPDLIYPGQVFALPRVN